MSYNYDMNPWDDNYSNQNQNVQNQQQQPTSADNYSTVGNYASSTPVSGYSNPSEQYGLGADSWNDTAQMQYGMYNSSGQQQQQQQVNYGTDPYQQASPEMLQADGSKPPTPPPESGFKRFLRAHVPLCGICMDLSSTICTPIFDTLLKYVNRDLLVSKIFYFFFYSAFGSLFPLMGVYFKQLGMNPAQVGILTGVRPFIEIFSAPFWSGLAERFHKGKALLLFSLISWIVFTYSLAHIRPPASACVAFNDTDYVLYTPYSANDLSNYDVGDLEHESETSTERQNEMFINKMPLREGETELERKNEVLAVEENQSLQGSRRRKREASMRPMMELRGQLDRPHASRYVYSVDGQASDGDSPGGDEDALLDLDLENDFDDTPEQSRPATKSVQSLQEPINGVHSFSGAEENGDEGDDDGEMESSQGSNLWRYRRNAHPGDYESEPNEMEGEHELAEKSAQQQEGANERGRKQGSDMGDDYNAREEPEELGEESGGVRADKNHERTKNGKVGENGRQANNGGGEEEELEEEEEGREKMMEKQVNKQNGQSKNESPEEIARSKGELGQQMVNKTKKVYRQRHKTPPTHIVGVSPITVQYAVNYNKEKHSQFVTPMFSTIVYKLDDIKEVFFLLLLLISLGEFFSAPAITIADSITLQYLGDNTDLYGRQRTFGSIGWAITLMLVGMALDNSTFIAGHPCGPHQRERNYTVCFTIFSLLMGCAFITATQFNFYYSQQRRNDTKGGSQTLVTSTIENDQIITTTATDATTANVDDPYASTRPREIFNTAPPVNAPPPGDVTGAKEKFEFLDKWKSAMFAQRTRELPEWVNVFRQSFSNPMQLIYLFITWFLGCGVGLVFTFLFWHLQDVGGTPTLFGICSVINHISEVLAYFFSSHFIKRFGHTRVLSVGLGCNLIRFLYVAFLSNPYYALPFELVQGITHAACFAACCSYMSHVSKPELRTSTQGVMQGLHHGIGRACGTLLGGYMINAIGSRASFCIYGLLSGCVLGGFLYARKKASLMEDEEVKVDDSETLGGYGAPQGVPSAIPGKISAQPVQQQDYQW